MHRLCSRRRCKGTHSRWQSRGALERVAEHKALTYAYLMGLIMCQCHQVMFLSRAEQPLVACSQSECVAAHCVVRSKRVGATRALRTCRAQEYNR